MNGLTNYLTLYVVAGMIALTICRLVTWIRRRYDEHNEVHEVLKSISAPKMEKARQTALKNAIFLFFALLLWPLVILIVVWELIESSMRGAVIQTENDPQNLFFAAGNLVCKLTRLQAESLEKVDDPLGKTPIQPFGHLYTGWLKFLEKKPSENAELWSFNRVSDNEEYWSIDRANGIGRGYCWVLDGKVVSEIRIEGS